MATNVRKCAQSSDRAILSMRAVFLAAPGRGLTQPSFHNTRPQIRRPCLHANMPCLSETRLGYQKKGEKNKVLFLGMVGW